MTRARDLPNLATNISFSGSNVGIGTTIPSAVLDVRGNPWFRPNETGVKATALRLGRFSDSAGAAFDIITDDNTGDDIEIQSNRYTGKLRFSRSSPAGIQTTFILDSHYQNGTSISIGDTTATSTKIKLDEAGNTYFNNSGAVLVGTTTSTGTASQTLQVTGGGYISGSVGIGTTRPTTTLQVQGSSVALDTRIQSVCEETTLISGNTASLVYNTGGGNIAICTNATGDITLAVTGIPTDSTFNNNSITFSVCCLQTGVARSCTAVTLNGFNTTIRWAGGSLSNSISGVTTTSGMDIYSFTGINTVGSASTTANYYILGSVNGGYR